VRAEHLLANADGGKTRLNVAFSPVLGTSGRPTFVLHSILSPFAVAPNERRTEPGTERARPGQQAGALATQLSRAEELTRQKVAEELHERVGQTLVALKLKLELLGKQGLVPRHAESVGEAIHLLDAVVEGVHSLMRESSPPFLHERGLEAAVGWLVSRVRAQHGVRIAFVCDDKRVPLGREARTFLFHALKELLTNAVKHARAKHVRMSLSAASGRAVVRVEDDGVGFDPEQQPTYRWAMGGFGLAHLSERFSAWRGQFTVESHPGHGTKVTASLPLEE
jgi:signal transduction histidine kinase